MATWSPRHHPLVPDTLGLHREPLGTAYWPSVAALGASGVSYQGLTEDRQDAGTDQWHRVHTCRDFLDGTP